MPVLRLLAACAAAVLAGLAAAAQPNVVVIVADDLGYGDVGYNGSEIRTPNLDALAAEGVVLDRFYVSPLCSPSRAGVLTGRYGVRMGINEPITHADTVGLPQSEVTLAEYLGEAGYETAAVGKWHLGDGCHQHPTRHGFDSFLGLVSGGANYFDRRTSYGTDWWRGFEPDRPTGYTTDLIADEAVEILRHPRAVPLFLYLPFTAPHTPLQALDEDLALYPDLSEPRRTYAAMVTRLDHAVGRVMEAVRTSGEDTVVWFLSDNGGLPRHGGDNGPLRGQKGYALEAGIRVPSVVWYPPWGARRVDHPVWYLDVLPTLVGFATDGAPTYRRPLDGTDQLAQLQGGPPTEALLGRVLYSYRRLNAERHWLSAQNADWKYLSQPLQTEPSELLYRIGLDPRERSDSLSAYPDLVAALRDSAYAFAALTRRGASHDTTLTEVEIPDLAECVDELGTPPGARPDALVLRVGPNPFADEASVRVESPIARRVRVEVLDALGRRVRILYEGPVEAAIERAVPLRAGGLPSGVYVVRAVGEGVAASTYVVLAR